MEGLNLIKEFESCSLSAYFDRLGMVWTIAWGRVHGVHNGDTCTQDQADAWLLEDLAAVEAIVLRCLQDVPVTDSQLSALDSFAYNVGFGVVGEKSGFKVLEDGSMSTMLKCLLDGDYAGAGAQFPYWDHAGGITVPGLLTRRKAEQALFLKESGDGNH